VPCPALQFFPHYLINGTIFEKKKVFEHKMCVLIFSTTLSVTILVARRTERHLTNYIGLHVKYRLLLSDFKETLNFRDRFSKNTQILNLIKNSSSGGRVVPCGQTDRQTGRYAEANDSFSQFCERANKTFAWFCEGNEPNATPDRPLALFVAPSRKENF
jgi:hypothetical protein